MADRDTIFLRDRWESFDDAIARWEGVLLNTLLFVMLIFGFLQVVARNVFHSGIFGADLLLRQGLLWIGILGASLAARGRGSHIEFDILSRAVPANWARLARRLTDLFATLICALLARASLLFVASEFEATSRIAGTFPAWVFQAILPTGFGMMAIRFLAGAVLGHPAPTPKTGEERS